MVRRLARDLDIPGHIAGVPTVRDAHGLVLSSRNIYFSAEERRIAANLARVLRSIATALARDPTVIAREIARGLADNRDNPSTLGRGHLVAAQPRHAHSSRCES